MSDWKEVVEDGCTFWIHDTIGNVMQLEENCFIAMVPKVIKLGPFTTLKEAQLAADINRTAIDEVLLSYNDKVLNRGNNE